MSRCLIIKNDGIGDAILSLPLLEYIRDQSCSEIDILCKKGSEEIFNSSVYVNKVYAHKRDLYFKFPNVRNIVLKNKIKEIIKWVVYRARKEDKLLAKQLSENNYETIIVLRRYIRQSTFYFLTRIRANRKLVVWQYPTNLTEKKSIELTLGVEHITASENILHESEYYKKVLSEYYSTDNMPAISHKCISKTINSNNNPISIAFVLGNIKRGIRGEIIDSILKLLISRGYYVNIYGGPDTKRYFDNVVLPKNVELHAGLLSIHDGRLHVKKNNQFIIANDTGFTHIVCQLGLPIFIICGGETPFRFFPWPASENQYILYKPITCFDCAYCIYSRRYCMDFSVEYIENLLSAFLSGDLNPGVINDKKSFDYPIAHRWVK